MDLNDFAIGETFWTHGGAFRCTDIGTRVVVAVKLGPREIATAESEDGDLQISKRIEGDPSWLNGPPYAVEEVVFDENELVGCFRTEGTAAWWRVGLSESLGRFQSRKVTLYVPLRD